jgi:hypothetical protein
MPLFFILQLNQEKKLNDGNKVYVTGAKKKVERSGQWAW